MQIEVKYPYEDIDSERAKEYLHGINCDIFNGDTTQEDLEELQLHLGRYIELMKRANQTVVLAGPYVSPGGHY